MNCPCCKMLNAFREAAKHPSMTSLVAVKRLSAEFNDPSEAATSVLVDRIAACEKHGSIEQMDRFWSDYDHRAE